MAWKLRKDKLKSDESEVQDPDVSPAAADQAPAESQPAAFEPVGTPLGYDLGANVSPAAEPILAAESTDEPQFVEDALPKFADEELPRFLDDTPRFHSLSESSESSAAPVEDEPVVFDDVSEKNPIELGQPQEQEPISLGAFTPYQPPSSPDPVAELEPLPEFDPVIAPSTPDLEPEAVAIAPLVFTPDVENAESTAAENESDTPVTLPAEEPVAPPVEAVTAPAEEPLTFLDEPSASSEEPAAFADEPIVPAAELVAAVEEPTDAVTEPLTFAEEEIPAVAPFDVSPEREAAAPGLVSTESETGMPVVAPFILDTPDVTIPTESERMHHVVLRLGNLSASYILVKDVTTIGRPDSVVQNYPDIEVELDDGVSRRHAEIRKQNDQFYVVDVGSTNGTILNGEMLSPEQPVPLRTGDRIRIGERAEMLFE